MTEVQGSGDDKLQESELMQFIGSEVIYQHPVFPIEYTEGVQYMAQKGGAYWLIEAIAIWQMYPAVRDDEMLQEIQFWKLKVKPDRSAVLSCERDSDDVVVQQEIPFTDFPFSITLYLQNSTLLLPSEY
jgi:hypothetical protein